jgi:glycosyltransferase involved in cell wall biosynthesis
MDEINKIRLLLLVHLPPPKHGVSIINSYAESILRASNKFVITTIPIRPSKNINSLKGIGIQKFIYSIKLLFTLFFRIIVFKPQRFYFTPTPKSPVFFRDLIFIILAKLSRARVFLHFHRQGLNDIINKNLFVKNLAGFVLKNCTLIHITPYLVEKEFIETNLNKKTDTHFIPNPAISTPIFLNNIEKRQSQILFFSNIMHEKGVLELVNCLPLVISQKPEARLLISGAIVSNSYYQNIIDRIVELNIIDYVVINPNPSNDEKVKLFNESEIFVLPSNEDCFPLVINEAISYNLPVITTNVGGLHTVFDDKTYNIHFTANDSLSLSTCICKTLEKENTDKGFNDLLSNFNNTFTERLITILSSE